jgi:hypothetical protein
MYLMFDAADDAAGHILCVLVQNDPKSVVVMPDPKNNMGQGQTPAAPTETADLSDMDISEDEEDVDEDFTEEISKYHRQKLSSAGSNPLKERHYNELS